MISRLSRSGYVTFLPPAHFKQSSHEFVTRDYVVCGMSHWLACVVVCTSILTILEIYLFCELVEIAFELGCSSLRCVGVGVTLWYVYQFWQCWSFQRCVSLDNWHRTLGAIYIHRSVPVMLGGPICSDIHQRWSYVFTMLSLGWIDCHGIK